MLAFNLANSSTNLLVLGQKTMHHNIFFLKMSCPFYMEKKALYLVMKVLYLYQHLHWSPKKCRTSLLTWTSHVEEFCQYMNCIWIEDGEIAVGITNTVCYRSCCWMEKTLYNWHVNCRTVIYNFLHFFLY